MRRRLFVLFIVTAVLVGPQVLVSNHARAMTTFVAGVQRTPPPEELTLGQTVRTLVLGVRIPRPVASAGGASVGLVEWTTTVQGPAGDLSVTVFPGGTDVVVLVHGYAAEHSQLLATARALHDEGYTVVAPDLRGVGGSDGDRTTLGFREAEDVAAVVAWSVDALGDERPVLYGFSMGAAAITGAVGRLDVPARALVLEHGFDRLHTTVGHRFGAMGLPPGLASWLLWWGGVHTGVDPAAVAPVDDALQVELPVLVVGGTNDPRVLPEDSRALAAAFRQGELALIDDLPHAELARHQPETWGHVVAPFLAGLR